MKNVPNSIYRLQLNEHFNLVDATQLLPYLVDLGVEGVYCSPYFAAYSPHGYDIVDPNRINPMVATDKQYEKFCEELDRLGLFHIADIVPNHMGVKGDNAWLHDVLEKGEESPYANHFDIDWSEGKITLPIMGVHYNEALQNGDLTIAKKEGRLFVHYGDQDYPLDPKTYTDKTPFKGAEAVDALLSKQHFRLVHWRMSAEEIFYRRFFNINELIGLRIEDENVLNDHHKWLFSLLKRGVIDGLRVDHPDGLYDPYEYFERLRKHHDGLIVVEKILGWGEQLPENWAVEGTVGYEYMNMLSGLFVKPNDQIQEIYSAFIGKKQHFEEMLYEKKTFYMKSEMAADVAKLADLLYEEIRDLDAYADLPVGHVRNALYQVIAYFPVYRSYIRAEGKVPKQDRPYIEEALKKARKYSRELEPLAFDLIESVLTLQLDSPSLRDWIMRFQQLSAPIMAKGFEDITLYNYNPMLALNEVGSDPERGGVKPDEFHAFCVQKQKKWPYGFLASSTHDTKRSMDVRMQISVLSEMPEAWEKALITWAKQNKRCKKEVDGELFPDPDMEYVIYQTLLGAWPSDPSVDRLYGALQKAAKEARAHTSWRHPSEAYEKALLHFLRDIMKKGTPFYESFTAFQKRIKRFGNQNSLAAAALKLGGPGIVDLYEGCEGMRYTLVDPDNRRPVDFTKFQEEAKETNPHWLKSKDPDRVKFFLYREALRFRKQQRELFLKGQYIPLKVTGPESERVIAYLRTIRGKTCLIAASRFPTSTKSWRGTKIHLATGIKGKPKDIFSHQDLKLSREISPTQIFSHTPFAWIYWS